MKRAFVITLCCFILISCKKLADRPKSKTDYIPINSASTQRTAVQGQFIHSRVNCGFYNRFADITFLNFEVNEHTNRQYEIRARAFYDNIRYGVSFPVVSTFDTTLVIQAPSTGQYILKFYSFDNLVQTDTVQVN